MHRCLNVDEILRLVAENVAERHGLLDMALTCKTFHGPAIDTLWEDLPGLHPLLPFLAKDTCRSTEQRPSRPGSEISWDLRSIRDPVEDKWSHVLRVVWRVRCLTLSLDRSRECFPSILGILRDCPGPLLFPNLRHLRIKGCSIGRYCRLFIPPTLQSIDFINGTYLSIAGLCDVLHSATEACDIRILSISPAANARVGTLDIMTYLVDTLSRVVLRQTRLECLSVPCHMSENALIHLAHIPSLEYLDIEFDGGKYTGRLEPSSANFARLTELCLDAANYSDDVLTLTLFLAAFSPSSPLQQLTLGFTSSAADASLPDLFATIPRFASLTSCNLELSSLSLGAGSATVSTDILKPLYLVEAMSSLDLALLPMDISANAIQKMAAAWPRVQRIQLGQENRNSTSNLTLEDMAPLVEKCPDITYFGAIFLSETQREWVPPPSGRSQRRMTVDVGFSRLRLRDTHRLAAVFARLFPAGGQIVSPVTSQGRIQTEFMKETGETVAEINHWQRLSGMPYANVA